MTEKNIFSEDPVGKTVPVSLSFETVGTISTFLGDFAGVVSKAFASDEEKYDLQNRIMEAVGQTAGAGHTLISLSGKEVRALGIYLMDALHQVFGPYEQESPIEFNQVKILFRSVHSEVLDGFLQAGGVLGQN